MGRCVSCKKNASPKEQTDHWSPRHGRSQRSTAQRWSRRDLDRWKPEIMDLFLGISPIWCQYDLNLMVCFSEMYRNVMKYLLVREGILHIMSSSCIDNNAQYIGSFRLKPTQKQVCSGNTRSVEKMNDDQWLMCFSNGQRLRVYQDHPENGGQRCWGESWYSTNMAQMDLYYAQRSAPTRSLSTKSEPNTCIYMIYHTSKYPYAYIYIWQIHLFTILIWYTLYIYYTHNYVL